ncbi:MAG: DUF5050 domain-containing protein [Oscillospiraceae bacterium]|nr:DUF5050 domain-containing protein [Oscillospiraceae bacterium]
MDKETKIKLIDENSGNRVHKKLEEISKQKTSVDEDKHKLNNLFVPFAICMIIGIWIGFLLSSYGFNGSMFVYYNQDTSESSNSSKGAKNSKSSKSKKSSSNSVKAKSSKSSKSKTSKNSKSKDSDSQSTDGDEKHGYINNSIGNTVSNILNGGFLAEEDEWIYYIDSDVSNNLYRKNYNNLNVETVFDVPISAINILKNKVYAKQTNLSYLMIQKEIDKNILSVSSIGCDYISVFSDYIITSDNNGIYYMTQNSDIDYKDAIYTGEITSSAVYDNIIYFVQYDSLYQIDIKGNNKKLIKENISTFTVGDFGLYYISNNKLYINGNDSPLFGISLSSLNIHDGVIYFGNLNDGNKLYSINLDGSNLQKLSDVKADKICVTDHQIAVKSDDRVILL